MEDLIKTFLELEDGDGSGSGSGSGYGDGYGIKSINGMAVYLIDEIPTVIYQVRGSIAKVGVLGDDLVIDHGFVVKGGTFFAHGETLHEAFEALNEKLFVDMPPEERVKAFAAEHRAGVLYQNQDFFEWHHRLTGSCEMGRRQFAKDHGVDLSASMTPEDFIRLTEHSYGGDVIRMLMPLYGMEEKDEDA